MYLEVILKELVCIVSNTYTHCNIDTINEHLKMNKLPSLYCLPKLHKNPYGNRFIVASNCCTTKPLSHSLFQYYYDTF